MLVRSSGYYAKEVVLGLVGMRRSCRPVFVGVEEIFALRYRCQRKSRDARGNGASCAGCASVGTSVMSLDLWKRLWRWISRNHGEGLYGDHRNGILIKKKN